ncbi:MAG TPA: 4Fe-4S binding protein [Saprospiraceae bacterium]|nr:4Fe-4S binding protein [Saprospiraceae bacterium]
MKKLQNTGLIFIVTAIVGFTIIPFFQNFTLTEAAISGDSVFHGRAMIESAKEHGIIGKTYSSNISLINDLNQVIQESSAALSHQYEAGLKPEEVEEWDFKIGSWKKDQYLLKIVRNSETGMLKNHPLFFLLFITGVGIFGAALFIIPLFYTIPGIKNNKIYHQEMTKGTTLAIRKILLSLLIPGVLLYGVVYMQNEWLWPAITLVMTGLITYFVFIKEKSIERNPQRSASVSKTGYLGMIMGVYLISFYITLYWAPEYITGWMSMLDPLSLALNGGPASQWFVYGFLYTLIVLIMGVRMVAKYRHSRYQMLRTGSVIFFQTGFAFLIPEILVRLNQPWFDFKNIWPLNYSFFFDWNLNQLISSGGLGIFMLVWGIILIFVGVPLLTYFYGKRWYCSWVCGCGGLAETLGDPYRQLSDKSLRAWQYERYIVHGVLVFAVVMTVLVLYTFITGSASLLFLSSDTLRGWYGFLIGSAFAGVAGTGLYPIMGNRVWCRYGCPLAAYLGLVQKFKSRFRITVNGGQCISCGNCSTYCEMGIDVKWYAQRGQDIVRASCVGCGICSEVCPRGVLRLENNSSDLHLRTHTLRTLNLDTDTIQIK